MSKPQIDDCDGYVVELRGGRTRYMTTLAELESASECLRAWPVVLGAEMGECDVKEILHKYKRQREAIERMQEIKRLTARLIELGAQVPEEVAHLQEVAIGQNG